jgi:hypothetical protein
MRSIPSYLAIHEVGIDVFDGVQPLGVNELTHLSWAMSMTRSMERVREMLLMGYSHLGKIRAYSSLSMLSGHWKTKQNSANYVNSYMSYI